MKNRKIFALAISFLVLGNNCQQLKAVPPKLSLTQQVHKKVAGNQNPIEDEAVESERTSIEERRHFARQNVKPVAKIIEDCDNLLVFELCDWFRSILTLVDMYAPDIVTEIQSGEIHDHAVSASTVGLKKLFTVFSGYDKTFAMLGSSDTIAVSDMQGIFANVYPHDNKETGGRMRELLKIIKEYIPEKDGTGISNIVFSVATLTVKRQEFYDELGKLQKQIVEYFNREYHSIEEVRSIITERFLRNLKHTLNDKLKQTELRKLEKYEKTLPLLDKVKTILLNIDEMLQQPTFFGTLWCGIKSFFG